MINAFQRQHFFDPIINQVNKYQIVSDNGLNSGSVKLSISFAASQHHLLNFGQSIDAS